jgi:hypothetical protein
MNSERRGHPAQAECCVYRHSIEFQLIRQRDRYENPRWVTLWLRLGSGRFNRYRDPEVRPTIGAGEHGNLPTMTFNNHVR